MSFKDLYYDENKKNVEFNISEKDFKSIDKWIKIIRLKVKDKHIINLKLSVSVEYLDRPWED